MAKTVKNDNQGSIGNETEEQALPDQENAAPAPATPVEVGGLTIQVTGTTRAGKQPVDQTHGDRILRTKKLVINVDAQGKILGSTSGK